MATICGERITQAREFAGLSKSALAEKLSVTPAAVAQWESGTKTPAAENLAAVSLHLGVPISFLLESRPAENQRRGPLTFRAWNSARTRRLNRKAERFAELVAEAYAWLEARVVLPALVLPEIPAAAHEGAFIEAAAEACRRAWGLGDRPILRLAELLESKGIIVAEVAFSDEGMDAFSCVVNGRPFVFLRNKKQDRARSRFDAAHELGHLLLHQHLSEGELRQKSVHGPVEEEAHAFAGAFLMPADSFRRDVTQVDVDSLLRLKPKWGVSVQAMVKRCEKLGLIDAEGAGDLFRQMGVRGWRRAQGEPYDEMLPLTAGLLGQKALRVLEENRLVHRWELSSLLPFPSIVLRGVFGQDLPEEPAELSKIIPINFNSPPPPPPTADEAGVETKHQTTTTMSKNQHVVPRDGDWAVHGAGNGRDTSRHVTQSAAIAAAREIAQNAKSEVVIHGRDGRIREKNSYGPDAFPPKG